MTKASANDMARLHGIELSREGCPPKADVANTVRRCDRKPAKADPAENNITTSEWDWPSRNPGQEGPGLRKKRLQAVDGDRKSVV